MRHRDIRHQSRPTSVIRKADETDPEKHNGICSKCGAEKPDSRAKHTFKDGICTGDGCNYDGKHNITDENRVEKKDPTCTADGVYIPQ